MKDSFFASSFHMELYEGIIDGKLDQYVQLVYNGETLDLNSGGGKSNYPKGAIELSYFLGLVDEILIKD